MEKAQARWRWQDAVVDARKEHIELRHGDAAESPYEGWVPIARIGKPKEHIFPVEWLVRPDSPEHHAMVADARRELDYYLVEKGESNPWAYARYHCSTASNMYSCIHWSYFQDGRCGKRVSSMVTKFSAKEAEETLRKPKRRKL